MEEMVLLIQKDDDKRGKLTRKCTGLGGDALRNPSFRKWRRPSHSLSERSQSIWAWKADLTWQDQNVDRTNHLNEVLKALVDSLFRIEKLIVCI